MSLSNEEIIARLKAAGVQAVSCPNCGRVKEVQQDKIVFHYVNSTEIICDGSDTDMLGDVDATFVDLTKGIEIEPPSTASYHRKAQEEAKERLTMLLERLEIAAEAASKLVPPGVPVFTTVEGPDGDSFCGCTSCIVREVTKVVWAYAAEGEVADIINYLMTAASSEGLDKKMRKACQHVADVIAKQEYHDTD